LFSQVALLALSVFGNYLNYEREYTGGLKTLEPIGGMSSQRQSRDSYTPQDRLGGGMYFSQSNFMGRQSKILNELINDKLKVLNSEIKNATISNNLDKMKKLKKSVDKTMKLAKLAKDLELKKVIAIENEDYDTAKMLKSEIDKVKKSLMSTTNLPSIRGSSLSNRSIVTPQSDTPRSVDDMTDPSRIMLQSIDQIESDLSRINVNLVMPNPQSYIAPQANRIYDQQIMNYDEGQEDISPSSQPYNAAYQQNYSSQAQEYYGGIPSYPEEPAYVHDEKVIPMANKAPIDFSNVEEEGKGDAQGGEIEEEELSDQNKAKLEVMRQYFKEETVRLVLSKKWQGRKKGLEGFIQEFPKSLKEHGVAVQEHAINTFMGCKDKIKEIVDLKLNLFEIILEESKKANLELKLENTGNKVTQMLLEILDLKALDITKNKLLTGGFFDYNTIASFILSEKSYKNRNFMSSEPHILFRLELISFMNDTSDKYPSKKPFPIKELLKYVFDKLSHANKEIRKKTQKIIVQIYHKSGWYALESHVSRNVPQNQLQYLVKDIPEVESLIKKKDTHKGSESLREALRAMKEVNQTQNQSSVPPKQSSVPQKQSSVPPKKSKIPPKKALKKR
jgi:hypothetical protein